MGLWVSCVIQRSMGIVANRMFAGLHDSEFYPLLSRWQCEDPSRMVSAILCGFPEAKRHAKYPKRARYENFHLIRKLIRIVNFLISHDDSGQRHAFELCFSIKTDNLLDDPAGRMLSPYAQKSLADLDRILYDLLEGGPSDLLDLQDTQPLDHEDLDMVAANRRLGSLPEPRQTTALTAKVKRVIQARAWSQIRTTTVLTIGTLLPRDVCEIVIDFALDAEDIPWDPTCLHRGKGGHRHVKSGHGRENVRGHVLREG